MMKEIFYDDYSDIIKLIKTTSELWQQFSKDARAGNYWGDKEHWVEIGKVHLDGTYELDPLLANAVVTDKVELVLQQTPEGYGESGAMVARYIRNPALATHGIIETGARYYVPVGSNPRYVHISIENHLSWLSAPLIHVGVDPITNKLATWVVSENGYPFAWEPLVDINFQHSTWFSIKLRYDTESPHEFYVTYESPVEQITVKSNRFVLQGMMPGFIGLPGFNFYAGALSLPGDLPSMVYVDDYYAMFEPKSALGILFLGVIIAGGLIYMITQMRRS